MNQFGIDHFIAYSDNVARATLAILVLMSVISWSVMLVKAWRAWRIHHGGGRIRRQFWREPASSSQSQHPYAHIAAAGIAAIQRYNANQSHIPADCSISDWLGGAVRNALAQETARLESGLTMLASIGSTAPFIGLFGTVWGIYHALVAVGTSGQATLDTVAGPVGEALIMTAIGLAVAIPAVLGYNALVRSNRVINAGFNTFAHELTVWLLSAYNAPPTAGEADTRAARQQVNTRVSA